MDRNLSHYKQGSILKVYVHNCPISFLFMIIEKMRGEVHYLLKLDNGERYHIEASLFFNSNGTYGAIESIEIMRGGLKDEYST